MLIPDTKRHVGCTKKNNINIWDGRNIVVRIAEGGMRIRQNELEILLHYIMPSVADRS